MCGLVVIASFLAGLIYMFEGLIGVSTIKWGAWSRVPPVSVAGSSDLTKNSTIS